MATFTIWTLYAWLPASLPPNLPWPEHVYVTSDDHRVWDCFGRSSGGADIDYATGDSLVAECLSKPKDSTVTPKVYAGLRYGLTGVCHQAANRVLHETGLTVAKAKAYRLSVGRFGAYGKGSWPELAQCVKLGPAQSGPLKPSQGGSSTMDTQEKAAQFQSRIRAIYTGEIWQRLDGLSAPDLQKQEIVFRHQELQAMADTYLGEEYDKSKIQAVIKFHVLSHLEQDELVSLLNAKQMTPERYLVAFNLLAVKTAKICEQILGAEDFERLFGASANDAALLIDKETFIGTR